ncbi:MAG: hypothetical protein U0K28_03740 [Prevotellamassilia sp.]|nr:hypothetical protein [Prevotellamassilia sp.]
MAAGATLSWYQVSPKEKVTARRLQTNLFDERLCGSPAYYKGVLKNQLNLISERPYTQSPIFSRTAIIKMSKFAAYARNKQSQEANVATRCHALSCLFLPDPFCLRVSR